jgi:hypothetical protein
MEYRRAYRDEQPNEELIERHRREIFPLFHRRYLFAEVTDFRRRLPSAACACFTPGSRLARVRVRTCLQP